jgi:hypothetical protein
MLKYKVEENCRSKRRDIWPKLVRRCFLGLVFEKDPVPKMQQKIKKNVFSFFFPSSSLFDPIARVQIAFRRFRTQRFEGIEMINGI